MIYLLVNVKRGWLEKKTYLWYEVKTLTRAMTEDPSSLTIDDISDGNRLFRQHEEPYRWFEVYSPSTFDNVKHLADLNKVTSVFTSRGDCSDLSWSRINGVYIPHCISRVNKYRIYVIRSLMNEGLDSSIAEEVYNENVKYS